MRSTVDGVPAVEYLEDRVVLGIDRQDRDPRPAPPPHEQRAGGDQALLVGERDPRASADRREGRRESRRRRRSPPPRDRPVATAASITAAAPAAAAMPDAGRALPSVRRKPAASAMTAIRAPVLRAIAASCAALALAVTASTAKASGRSAMTESVLVPIDPVAPRMVMRRGATSAADRLRAVGARSPREQPLRDVRAAVELADQSAQAQRRTSGRRPGP